MQSSIIVFSLWNLIKKSKNKELKRETYQRKKVNINIKAVLFSPSNLGKKKYLSLKKKKT